MAEDNADYILISPTQPKELGAFYLVAIMRWEQAEDSYVMRETAGPMSHHAAVHLAAQWAQERKLEVRS